MFGHGSQAAYRRSTRLSHSPIAFENTRLTTFPGQDTKPACSPTGDRIAFHRQIDGHLQGYTMNADGTGVTPITFTATPQVSGFPSWGKWSAQQP